MHHRSPRGKHGLSSRMMALIASGCRSIALLVEDGRWEEALSLGLDFFEGKAKTAEGLPADQNMMRQVVADHMIEV